MNRGSVKIIISADEKLIENIIEKYNNSPLIIKERFDGILIENIVNKDEILKNITDYYRELFRIDELIEAKKAVPQTLHNLEKQTKIHDKKNPQLKSIKSNSEMIEGIRKYLGNNEPQKAIEKMFQLIDQLEDGEEFRDNLILLNANLTTIEEKELKGISSSEELFMERNNIINKLIRITNALGKLTAKDIKPNVKNDSLFNNMFTPIQTYNSMSEAQKAIKSECYQAKDIKILSIKGLEFLGLDSSIISVEDYEHFKNLKKIKIMLLSPESRWLNRGFVALRRYETVDIFKKELATTHQMVEYGMAAFAGKMKLQGSGSGIKYHKGEPYFRMIMTENLAFVSSYAETPSTQVRDLPVFVFKNEFGSLYGAIRRHFNDIWRWNSYFGDYMNNIIEAEVSAGGILVHKYEKDYFVALVMREDGSWVLPKGHKKKNDKDIESAAIREISEEVGISIEDLKVTRKIDSYSYDESAELYGSKKIVHLFLVEYSGKNLPILVTDPDHVEAKWWNLRDKLPFMFYNYQKTLLSEIIENDFHIKVEINQR